MNNPFRGRGLFRGQTGTLARATKDEKELKEHSIVGMMPFDWLRGRPSGVKAPSESGPYLNRERAAYGEWCAAVTAWNCCREWPLVQARISARTDRPWRQADS